MTNSIFWGVCIILVTACAVWMLHLGNEKDRSEARKLDAWHERIERADEANRIMSDKLHECRSKLPPEGGQ